jgi:hypothetical protein
MAFWRRSKGRHALGAAVTSIPAAPVVAQPLLAGPAPTVVAPPPAPAPQPALDWSFPELHPAPPPAPPMPEQPVAPGPRVELTFRDGTSASLDATQARALDEIAQVLTRRD